MGFAGLGWGINLPSRRLTDALALYDPDAALARPDLAESGLEGLVRAAAYRATEAMRCALPTADLFAAPGGERIDQLIFGEAFDALEIRDGFVWGRARRDGVTGWVEAAALSPGLIRPTHRVRAVTAEVFAGSDGGAASAALSMNALIQVEQTRDGAARIAGGGWIALADLADFNAFDADPAAVAERWLGVPHVLGGRSGQGTDCSGLVQQALYACGRAGPRHARRQIDLGRAVDTPARGDVAVWARGDLAHWGGHSGIMLDGERLIHASGARGAVVIETLAEADARCRADGFDAPVFRRLD